jgi:hypothetical protein
MWLLSGCANSYKGLRAVEGDANCVARFRPSFDAQLYKTNAQLTGHALSGLLLIKSMPDSSTRVVFTTETGISFFDFSFGGPQDFKVYQIMKKLDKKVIVTALRNDFELLLMRWVPAAGSRVKQQAAERYQLFSKGSKIAYYVTDTSCTRLLRGELGSARKRLMTAYWWNNERQVPDSMFIRHDNFNFTISLKKLER